MLVSYTHVANKLLSCKIHAVALFNYKCYRGRYGRKKKLNFLFTHRQTDFAYLFAARWTVDNQTKPIWLQKPKRRDGLLFQWLVFICNKLLVIFLSILISMPIIDVHLVVERRTEYKIFHEPTITTDWYIYEYIGIDNTYPCKINYSIHNNMSKILIIPCDYTILLNIKNVIFIIEMFIILFERVNSFWVSINNIFSHYIYTIYFKHPSLIKRRSICYHQYISTILTILIASNIFNIYTDEISITRGF